MSQKRVFGKYLEQFPEEVRKIALNLRVLILKIIPRVVETVRPGMKWITYGVPKSILAIKPQSNHVRLYFFEGVQLDNSNGLLRGSGTRMRFLTITNFVSLKDKIGDLVDQAWDINKKKKFRVSEV